MILTGYNHSVPVGDRTFHIQTEHHETPEASYIETEIFSDGQVLRSMRLPRRGRAESPDQRRALAADLRKVHKTVIQRLLTGRLTLECSESGKKIARAFPQMGKVAPLHSATHDRELRRMLARYIRAVGTEAPATRQDLVNRLRSVTSSLAVILGHPSTSFMRRDDLAELVMRRSEVLEFLRAGAAATLVQGLEIWQAFETLARSFRSINRRRALVELDLDHLGRSLARLREVEDKTQLVDAVSLAELRLCSGRDEALDEILGTPLDLTVERALGEVTRLVRELGVLLDSLGSAEEEQFGTGSAPGRVGSAVQAVIA